MSFKRRLKLLPQATGCLSLIVMLPIMIIGTLILFVLDHWFMMEPESEIG